MSIGREQKKDPTEAGSLEELNLEKSNIESLTFGPENKALKKIFLQDTKNLKTINGFNYLSDDIKKQIKEQVSPSVQFIDTK